MPCHPRRNSRRRRSCVHPPSRRLKARRLGFGFQQHQWRAAERRHPTDRERMVSPTLRTLQDPILLLPWLCFRGDNSPKTQPRDAEAALTQHTRSIARYGIQLERINCSHRERWFEGTGLSTSVSPPAPPSLTHSTRERGGTHLKSGWLHTASHAPSPRCATSHPPRLSTKPCWAVGVEVPSSR